MKLLGPQKFYRDRLEADWVSISNKDVRICMKGLARFIEIPRNAKAIWASLHDKPAENRLQIFLPRSVHEDITVDGKDEVIFLSSEGLLRRHAEGRYLYLEIEWE